MEKKRKYQGILILCFILLIGVLLAFLIIRNDNLKRGIEGQLPVKGTYVAYNDDDSMTYFTIDYGEGIDEFRYFRSQNNIIKSGSVKADDSNNYTLYDEETDSLYGKIIPSYKKIYFVDRKLRVKEFEYYSDVLVYPGK